MLTADQMSAYHREGYAIPEWRMADGDLAAIRDAADVMLSENPNYRDLHPVLMEEGEPWPGFAKNADNRLHGSAVNWRGCNRLVHELFRQACP